MRGAETIVEILSVEKDWQGDSADPDAVAEERQILGCQWIPILSPEDNVTVLDGAQIFVPPDQEPPAIDSTLRIRGNIWSIDGNIAEYDMKSNPKGALFRIKRVA